MSKPRKANAKRLRGRQATMGDSSYLIRQRRTAAARV
jgi:hypothetical protein